MNDSYALGDKKCNAPGAGDRQGAAMMLGELICNQLNLWSGCLSKILDEMGEKDAGITTNGFGLIEHLVQEAIRLRDEQIIEKIKSRPPLPGQSDIEASTTALAYEAQRRRDSRRKAEVGKRYAARKAELASEAALANEAQRRREVVS